MSLLVQYLQFFGALTFLYLFSFFSVHLTERKNDRSFLLKLVSFSFILNTITVIFISGLLRNKFTTPFLTGMDLLRFDRISWQLARSGQILNVQHLEGPAIYVLNASIFQIFGHNPLIIRGVYVFLVCLITVFSYKLAKDLFGSVSAKYTGILVAFYPNFFIYSALPHKEILVTFIGVFTIWNLLLGIRHLEPVGWLFGGIGFLFLYWSRPEVAIIILLIALFYLVYRRLGISWLQKGLLVMTLLFLIFCIGVTAERFSSNYRTGVYKGLRLLEPSNLISQLKGIKESQKRFESGGLGDYLLYASYPERLIIGFPYMLIKPFPPWKTLTRFGQQTLTTSGTLVWYLIMPFSIIGVLESLRTFQKDYLLIILVPVLVLAAVALFYGAETARYRVQIMPYLLVLAGLGIKVKRKYHQVIWWYIIAFFGGVVLYMLLKVLL